MPDRLTLLVFAVIVLIGGTNFVAVRFSNRELPPFWGASLRFAAAALLLLGLALVQRVPLPRGRALLGAVIYGLLGFGAGYAFAYWGLRHVPAGLAAVVLASAPLLTFLLAVLHRQEPFRWPTLAGGVIALAGIAVVFRGSVSSEVPYGSMLAMVAAAVCVAESTVLVKQFPKTHPVSTNVVALAAGVVVLAALSLLLREPWAIPARTGTWIALAYLVLLGSSTAFVLFLFVLKRWTASAANYQFVLFPIVAIVVAAILEGARVSASLLVGGGLVLASVYAAVISQPLPVETRPKLGPEPCLTCAE
ncbi:MAG: EamA family transporter [Armatimonadota bacterium]|nr:EamA family transporter [Armatimonadota bacterium]MDR7451728.1 EamA family transporter [Armatimonadota bacterium]MDR7465654.1 EamA family transporter [Armatimonadota bacterium]MDR7499533.1 EamA family transporter [Armatimonadota bacterium]MDR7503494.1 EamA family transporter [Armatimonadota bacterium]